MLNLKCRVSLVVFEQCRVVESSFGVKYVFAYFQVYGSVLRMWYLKVGQNGCLTKHLYACKIYVHVLIDQEMS